MILLLILVLILILILILLFFHGGYSRIMHADLVELVTPGVWGLPSGW